MSTIKIPPVLRAYTGGEREVPAEGATVGDVLNQLADKHPDTRGQLFGEDGQLNRFVNVYVNDEDVRVLDGLNTGVAPEDTLVILPAMAGGSGQRPHLEVGYRPPLGRRRCLQPSPGPGG